MTFKSRWLDHGKKSENVIVVLMRKKEKDIKKVKNRKKTIIQCQYRLSSL